MLGATYRLMTKYHFSAFFLSLFFQFFFLFVKMKCVR